jgi:S-adenosylmethionine synthetase
MKRYSEVVLNGHPDKFCDLIADRLILEIYKYEPFAYAQIEVAIWSDIIFLSGGVATRKKLNINISDVIISLGKEIGYAAENHIDVSKYRILNHICFVQNDPRTWTSFVNDQSIVVGYAGYDQQTHYLPPEHFLCWKIREEILLSMKSGLLQGHGPDGKILAIITEENGTWKVEQLLVTMQQKESVSFMNFTELLCETVRLAYINIKTQDFRWLTDWSEIKVLINPNGPLLNGGSDGDNGQTGRKLVMDFYGPRIPIGGGALYGKDLSHIDRLGANMARYFALNELNKGAKEVIVKVCYAPGVDDPLSVDIQTDKRPSLNASNFFNYSEMKKKVELKDMGYDIVKLGSYYNSEMGFNNLGIV